MSYGDPAPIIPAIVGPTASGKSALARELADVTGGRIISVDSRKIYRGLNIGSAKPSPEIIARYDYAMIDIIAPHEQYSAYQYAKTAVKVLEQTITSGKLPILSGGTGFYLRALKDGLFEGPDADAQTRADITALAEQDGWGAVFDKLREVDPETASRIDPHNVPRLVRALEIYYLTGEPISTLQKTGEYHRPVWRFKLFGIDRPRRQLYERIGIRTDRMVERGLFEEVEALLASGARPDAPGMRTVGYAEVLDYLEGKSNSAEAIEKIKSNTRRYAKRQLTWFRGQEEMLWLAPDKKMIGRIRAEIV